MRTQEAPVSRHAMVTVLATILMLAPTTAALAGGQAKHQDTWSVWFRGDVGGFDISRSQSKLTYNLLGSVEWRFASAASALVGFRY